MSNRAYRTTWFDSRKRTIQFTGKVNSFNTKDFTSAIDLFLGSKSKYLTLDFRKVERAYPNGVLPIISTIELIRDKGIDVYVVLPDKDNVRRLFRSVNWAHYLSPNQFEKSESIHDRHLVTRNFKNLEEQQDVVNDFMDMVLRNIVVPRDIIAGLEWSINELTDNVLNHADSKYGGYIQASTYPRMNQIAFAITDAGRGILDTLKEGIPSLRTDLEAIGEAIKEGVTRGKEFGQGNGLAGSLKVTTMTGGSFEVTSGNGRFVVTIEETKKKKLDRSNYKGTIVCGQINITDEFSAVEALSFGNKASYSTVDIIENMYEMEEEDALLLKMKNETTGFGTRKSGVQIRTKILNLLEAEKTYPLIIDWVGVPVISSSFADEVMGKLFLHMGALTFSARIRNKGMEELILKLIDKAIAQRLSQEKDV